MKSTGPHNTRPNPHDVECFSCGVNLNPDDNPRVEVDDSKSEEYVCDDCKAEFYNYDEFCDVYKTKEV